MILLILTARWSAAEWCRSRGKKGKGGMEKKKKKGVSFALLFNYTLYSLSNFQLRVPSIFGELRRAHPEKVGVRREGRERKREKRKERKGKKKGAVERCNNTCANLLVDNRADFQDTPETKASYWSRRSRSRRRREKRERKKRERKKEKEGKNAFLIAAHSGATI